MQVWWEIFQHVSAQIFSINSERMTKIASLID